MEAIPPPRAPSGAPIPRPPSLSKGWRGLALLGWLTSRGIPAAEAPAPDLRLRFNPWTETPVEGVHWRKGDDWGQAEDDTDYQLPRNFRISVGIRF